MEFLFLNFKSHIFFSLLFGILTYISPQASWGLTYDFIFPKCVNNLTANETQRLYLDKTEKLETLYSKIQNNDEYINCHLSLIENHKMALQWSEAIYSLDIIPVKPLSLRPKNSVPEFQIVAQKPFLGFPNNHKINRLYEDCKSGFHAAFAQDINEGLCIFSIAGTNQGRDIFGDLTLGRIQIKGDAQKLMLNDMLICYKNHKDLIITGHSLGGLLASYFGSILVLKTISEEDNMNNFQPPQVITWNAPGSAYLVVEDVLEEHSKNVNLKTLEAIATKDEFKKLKEVLYPENFRSLVVNDINNNQVKVPQLLDDILTKYLYQTHYNMSGDIVSIFGYQIGLRLEYPLNELIDDNWNFAGSNFSEFVNAVFEKRFYSHPISTFREKLLHTKNGFGLLEKEAYSDLSTLKKIAYNYILKKSREQVLTLDPNGFTHLEVFSTNNKMTERSLAGGEICSSIPPYIEPQNNHMLTNQTITLKNSPNSGVN